MLTFYVLEGFKLSNINYINNLQLIYFCIFIILFILYLIANESYFITTENINISGTGGDKKGFLDSTLTIVTDPNVIETIKETAKETTTQLGQSIENAAKTVSNTIVAGSVAGGTAYAIKNANLPPAAKAGLIVTSAAGSVIANTTGKIISNLNNKEVTNNHPDSPTADKTVNEFSPSSPLENFDLTKIFGLDPNNEVLNVIFYIFTLNFIITFLIYILTIYLIYIYIFNNKLELN